MKLDAILAKAFRTTDSARAFAHFLPLAEAVVLADGAVFRQDVTVARHNVQRAMSAMTPRLADVARLIGSVDVVALAERPPGRRGRGSARRSARRASPPPGRARARRRSRGSSAWWRAAGGGW